MSQESNKRIAKNTILLYIRQFFTLLLALYTSRLTLQVLGESDYGVFATVAGLAALISIVTSSMSVSTQRFMTFELGKGDIVKLNRVYVTGIQIHFFLALILWFIAEIIGPWFIYNRMTIPEERVDCAFWVFQVSMMGCVLNLINVPNNAAIIAHEDMGVYAIFSIADALLKLVFVLLLFIIPWDRLFYYSLSILIIQSVDFLICYIFCRIKYEEVRYHHILDKSLGKSMLSLAGWSAVLNIAGSGYIQGVYVLLNVFFGPIVTAAYSIAMQAYSGIRSFCSSFQLASNPQIVKLYSQGAIEEMNRLVMRVCKMCFFLILVLSLPFLLHANFFLDLWLKDVPKYTESFFILLLLYAYIDVLCYPMNTAAQATGNVKIYNIVTSVFVLLPLLVSYVAYINGANVEFVTECAIVMSLIGVYVRVFCLKWLTSFSMKLFFSTVVIPSVSVLTLSLLPLIVIRTYIINLYANVIITSVASIVISAIVIYGIGLDQDERKFVKNSTLLILSKFTK